MVGRSFVLGILLGTGACGPGGHPSPSQARATAPTPAAPTTAATDTPSLPRPTEVPGPPGATLDGPFSGAPAPGALGSLTWGDLTSDSPWIVPSEGAAVSIGAPLLVRFAPALLPVRWTARWARIVAGAAGPVESGVPGTGAISLVAPLKAGPWSLAVEAAFGPGRHAAWSWRVAVTP